MMNHPANQRAWAAIASKWEVCIIFEQYLLVSCVEWSKDGSPAGRSNVEIRYLFDSEKAGYENAVKCGYTRLIGQAKKNRILLEALENRVRSDFPAHYERILKCVE